MKKRRALWGAVALAALAAAAPLVPGSPAYLPDFFGGDGRFYNGHPTRYWVRALDSPVSDVRYRAIHSLGAIGPEAGEAVPALAALLVGSPSRGTRIEAALALSKMAPASRAAVPALAQALADPEPLVRTNAILALIRLRDQARPAIPALIRALRDDANRRRPATFTFTIQEAAARALGWASAGSPDAVPALTEVLRDGGPDGLRTAAAGALGEVGPEARPAAALLRAMLQEKDPDLRQTAREALEKIEGGAPAGR
jgi:HEAT repeat protein